MHASTLTIQDIADLAGVQRPVVSMWRRRVSIRGAKFPFPAPVSRQGHGELFDRDAVVEYLAATGRGTNTEADLDAPAFTVPPGATLDDASALLCWSVLCGEDLAGHDGTTLTATAARLDPEDHLLLREIADLNADPALLTYVDDLMESSRGPAEALATLRSGSLGRERRDRGLTADAVAVLHAVVSATAAQLDIDTLMLDAGENRELLDVAALDGLPLLVTGDDPTSRTLRQWARIQGREVVTAATERTLSVVTTLGLTPQEALDAADRAVLDLGPGAAALIVGSASALTDALPSRLQQSRSATLRPGQLLTAVRLPRGYWRTAHRQALGLWLVLGDSTTEHPYVGDLDGIADVNPGDLAADVVAAVTEATTRGRSARSFRYLRSIALRPTHTGGPLVPRGARPAHWTGPGDLGHLEAVHVATLTTSEALTPLDVEVTAGPGRVIQRHRSLGDLIKEKKLRMYRGTRVDPHEADPAGTVPVWSRDAHGGLASTLRLDPLDAERLYPRAHRTEPGDVVYVSDPRPHAAVDAHGGAIAASPARILRLSPDAVLGPQTLAAVINHLAPAGADWQAWSFPGLASADLAALEAALAATADYRAELDRRSRAAAALARSLVMGVGAGTVTLATPSTATP